VYLAFGGYRYIPSSRIVDSYVNSVLLFEELPNYFPKQLHHCIFPPAVSEASNFSTSLPTLVIVHLFDYSHASGCEAISHCGFDLHFPDD